MTLSDLFSDIANAIREKDGTTDDIVASTFPERILAIESGGQNFSISIINQPNKTAYYVGDTFDSTGLLVRGTFDDGLSFDIPVDYLSILPAGELSESDDTVTVSFKGQSVYLAISVVERPVTTAHVFGVVWDYNNPSTALTRLTPTTDPNRLVTTTVESEPVPAVGNGSGSSPFDSYMPWSGMEEYNIVNNAVGPKQGESGFSRADNDTMVCIPEFYYAVIDDASAKKRYFYVSDGEIEGMEKHPGSGKYISRYTANSAYKSISGAASLTHITRATARNFARKGGTSCWRLLDFAAYCAWTLLYLVEFADWDSQAKVGRGYVDGNSAALNSGETDSMTYHTGRSAGEDGKTAVQYRHIENPWGNIRQFVDGINFINQKAYICTNPAKYADDVITNYTDTGIILPSSYITGLGYNANEPWLLIPNAANDGSDSTYIPDYVYSKTGVCILTVGGNWANASVAGAFYFDGYSTSASNSAMITVRLLYSP